MQLAFQGSVEISGLWSDAKGKVALSGHRVLPHPPSSALGDAGIEETKHKTAVRVNDISHFWENMICLLKTRSNVLGTADLAPDTPCSNKNQGCCCPSLVVSGLPEGTATPAQGPSMWLPRGGLF